MIRKIRPGGWAWVGLAVGVTAVDYSLLARKKATMSEVFGDALRNPIKRWPVMTAWGLLTLHLFGNLLPKFAEPLKAIDPIGFVARGLTVE